MSEAKNESSGEAATSNALLGGKDYYEQGLADGLAGKEKPTGNENELCGWNIGNAKRRIIAGDAIGLVSTGTKCDACGEQNWGYRLGCRCNKSLDDKTVRYGLLVSDGSGVAKFMTLEEVEATGKPLIDTFTGEDVPLDA